MKVKNIEVTGLCTRHDCKFKFHDDLNIITGINGSGKTSLLKLIWYSISGNIERISPEIEYQTFYIETDLFSVHLKKEQNAVHWKYLSKIHSESNVFRPGASYTRDEGPQILNRLVIEADSSSLYFPTFRRIEGGYSMSNVKKPGVFPSQYSLDFTNLDENDDIQTRLNALAERISVRNHKFICSISTNDIIALLTGRYAKGSEYINGIYKKLSTSIIAKIEGAKFESKNNRENAYLVLNEIEKEVDDVNKRRDSILKPFAVLSEFTSRILRHKGIKLQNVTLGKAESTIDSANLSAGEKQMLSFLCYNAFARESIILIDEPELSLHPDWQRKLFPTLLEQETTNQFIMATHSPFIYSKYEDKELMITEEKGI